MEITKGHTYFKRIDKDKIHKRLHEDAFPFSQNLMWDCALENIDLQKHKRYIIERVMTRGKLEDFYLILKIYNKEEIVAALQRSKELDKKTANFCEHYFELPIKSLHVSTFYGRE
jgi:hypothetical protein